MSTTYGYDESSRLVRLTHASSQTLEDFLYTYTVDDDVETVSSITSSTRLPAEKNASPADADNRVTQFGQASYSFNELGQTTGKTDGLGSTSYQWDGRGRLTQATLANGQTVSYSYDASGRRASRTQGGSTTTFLYNGPAVVLDRSTDGSTVDYLGGPGVDNLLRQQSSVTGAVYFAQDHLGSTVGLMNASGGVVESHHYEPFGESTGSSLTRYGFTGRERDNATGLIYYRARWYDPQIGRFISEDPIGFGGGDVNLYGYAWQNPMNFRDPFGLDGWGNDVANWLDKKIDVASQYWQYNEQEWVANGVNNSVADVAHGVADLFRVGSGVGDAIYADDNGYGRAANVAMDISRASGIFGILGGGGARFSGGRGVGGAGRGGSGSGGGGGGGGGAPKYCPPKLSGSKPPKPGKPGAGFPDEALPRNPKSGRPIPESDHPHTQLGTRTSKKSGKKYPQAREFGENGKHVRDVDFTDHGRLDHTNPHQHVIDPVTGKRGPPTPLPPN